MWFKLKNGKEPNRDSFPAANLAAYLRLNDCYITSSDEDLLTCKCKDQAEAEHIAMLVVLHIRRDLFKNWGWVTSYNKDTNELLVIREYAGCPVDWFIGALKQRGGEIDYKGDGYIFTNYLLGDQLTKFFTSLGFELVTKELGPTVCVQITNLEPDYGF